MVVISVWQPAAIFMRKYSYKVGVLIGLALYATGALLFYPAAKSESFMFFCIGLYVLTFGLAFLETAANPYILAMGAKETATQRLNLAQSLNPVGLIAGLLVAKYFVYDNLQSDDIKDFGALDEARRAMIKVADLAVIRDPYVILGLVIIAVFVLFLVNKMPQSKEEGVMPSLGETFKKLGTNRKYVLGLFEQILYVGAQIMTWTYIYQYTEAIDLANADVLGYEKIDVFTYQFIAFVLFTVGRIVGTAMLRIMSSGKLLAFFATLATFCVIGAIFEEYIFSESIYGLYCIASISFCMSLMFPLFMQLPLMI